MTTPSGGVAVIATQLAQTDRRALSEAWYSALHLSRGTGVQSARAGAGAGGARGSLPAVPAVAVAAVPVRSAIPAASRPSRASRNAPAVPHERRFPPTETARRIERTVRSLAAPGSRASAHTIDVAGGRVRLLVRSDGRTTRIVALCSGTLHDAVERALASARFTLAGAGFSVPAP